MNEYAVPRLFALNGFDQTRLPTFEYGDIETPPLGELGNYVQVLAGAGVPLFPDDELENYLRSVASLPQRSKRSGAVAQENIATEGQSTKGQPTQKQPTASPQEQKKKQSQNQAKDPATTPNNESIRDSARDVSNYGLILALLEQDKWK